MLVHRAPLHRHAIPNGGNRALEARAAIDDEQLGPPQAALDEIVEHGAPSLGAAHLLDRQEDFLAVGAHLSMRPGMTALTVILCSPSSGAADFIRPMMPHLDAE
jgi:hypothetical protein